ncbi:MAG: hypothetical protein AABY93_14630 [Bacteroidota bacterium]
MELLETQDPERQRLIATSDRHKRELEKEVKAISDKTEQVLKNVLVIGGTLAITYFTITQITNVKSKRKKAKETKIENEEAGLLKQPGQDEVVVSEPHRPSFISQIGERIVSQATLVLLDLAKDLLMDYLESRKRKNENP